VRLSSKVRGDHLERTRDRRDRLSDEHGVGMTIRIYRAEDSPEICLRENLEYSRRLITQERSGTDRLSFHLTRYEPGFDEVVTGDDVHEWVLFCLSGLAELEAEDGTKSVFDPGGALYLGTSYRFRLRVLDLELVVAVACSPPIQ
jgi:hypothetical protein